MFETEGEKAFVAFLAGLFIIGINMLPLLFNAIKSYRKARTDPDNFNYVEAIGMAFIWQIVIAGSIFYLIHAIEIIDESNSIVLTGKEGVFYLFWEENLIPLLAKAKEQGNMTLYGTYNNISTARGFFEVLASLSIVIAIFMLGVLGGITASHSTKRMPSSTDFLKITSSTLLSMAGSFIFITFFAELSSQAMFMETTIVDIYSNWWTTAVDGVEVDNLGISSYRTNTLLNR